MDIPDLTTLKCCLKCGEMKPATREYFRVTSSGSLRAGCRACEAEAGKAWYAVNKEHKAELDKVRREANKERIAETSKAWRAANKERRAEYGKSWREANPGYGKAWREANKERHAKSRKAWYEANKNRYAETHKAWYEANPEYSKKWYKANLDKTKTYSQRRRARKVGNGGNHTAADIVAIRAAQTDRKGRLICWRCGKPIIDTPHIDHWIPLKHGGQNDPGNLHYMHAKCNLSKGAKHPTEIGRLL